MTRRELRYVASVRFTIAAGADLTTVDRESETSIRLIA